MERDKGSCVLYTAVVQGLLLRQGGLKVLPKDVQVLDGLEVVLARHLVPVHQQGQVLRHLPRFDRLDADVLERGAERLEVRVRVELGAMRKATSPGEDCERTRSLDDGHCRTATWAPYWTQWGSWTFLCPAGSTASA